MDTYNGSSQSERTAVLKVNQLERKWQQILEEERRSYSRNKKLLEDFDRIEQQSQLYSRKTDRLKQAKHDYESYVSSVYPKWTKEIKQLQEAKKKKATVDCTPSSIFTDMDDKDDKGKKHVGIPLGDENVFPNPTFSSTPYRSGIELEEAERLQHSTGFDKYRQNVTQEHLEYNKHHPYNDDVYSFGHSTSRMNKDIHENWFHHKGFPHSHSMFPYVGTFPLSRQSYAIPFGSGPYMFQGSPSFGFDPKIVSNSSSYNDHEQPVFSVHPRFTRNGHGNNSGARLFEEFYRDPRNDGYDDKDFDPRSVEHKSGIFQGYQGNGNNLNNDSSETMDFKGCYNGGPRNSKTSFQRHHFQHMAGQHYHEEHLENSRNENISKYKKGAGKTAKNRGPDDIFTEKLKTEVSDKSGKLVVVGKCDGSPGDVKSLKELVDSTLNQEATEGNQIRKEQNGQDREEKTERDSCLSAIHKSEENLQDDHGEFHDTEQVSEVNDDVKSESDGSLPSTSKHEDKELENKLKDSNQKTVSPVHSTQVLTTFEKTSAREVPGKEDFKTSIIDDLLGGDVSDLEVSCSEASEKASSVDRPVSQGEHSQISEIISQKPDGVTPEMEDNLVTVNSKEVSQLRESEIEVFASNGHPSSNQDINVHKAKTQTNMRLKLDSQDSLHGNTKIEKRNKHEERDLDGNESLKQKSKSQENISLIVKEENECRHPLIDEKAFLTLLHVVDDDIEVSFSKELLYRNLNTAVEEQEEILRAAESGEGLDKFDPAVMSMALLDQLPCLVRTSGKGCLIGEEVLIEQKNCLNEMDLRASIDGSLTVLWKSLFSHILKMMQNDVMNAEQISEIFAPRLVSSNCTSIEKAVNLLERILSNSYKCQNSDYQAKELSENLDLLSERHGEDHKSEEEKSKSVVLEELSFTSEDSSSDPVSAVDNNDRKRNENKNETREFVSSSEDFEDEKSIPLTETDAYQKMLSSMKVSDEDEDIEEDFLGESAISEGNITGQTKEDHNTQQSPRQPPGPDSSSSSKNPKKSLKSKPKLSLFGNTEENDLGNSFGNDNEGILTSSWKSSEMSLSPPLSPGMEMGGYVPTVAGGEKKMERIDVKESDKGMKGPKQRILSLTEKKQDKSKTGTSKATQESKAKSRIQAGFWNHFDSESEIDPQVSHGADGDDDADDFDFYS